MNIIIPKIYRKKSQALEPDFIPLFLHESITLVMGYFPLKNTITPITTAKTKIEITISFQL